MKKVFTHENRMIVFNMKNLLQAQGIATVVVNEFAAGGAGELPAFDTWPELRVDDDARFTRAQAVLRSILDDSNGQSWFCRACQEENDAAFRICWNCSRVYQ